MVMSIHFYFKLFFIFSTYMRLCATWISNLSFYTRVDVVCIDIDPFAHRAFWSFTAGILIYIGTHNVNRGIPKRFNLCLYYTCIFCHRACNGDCAIYVICYIFSKTHIIVSWWIGADIQSPEQIPGIFLATFWKWA